MYDIAGLEAAFKAAGKEVGGWGRAENSGACGGGSKQLRRRRRPQRGSRRSCEPGLCVAPAYA